MSNPDGGSSSSQQDASNMRWQFIDASDNRRSNLTQVKRHVMQEYMRQKKGGSRQSESEEEISRPPPKRGRPRKDRAGKHKSRNARNDDQTASSASTTEPGPLSAEEYAPEDVENIQGWYLGKPILSHPHNVSFTLPFRDPMPETQGNPFLPNLVHVDPRNPASFHSLSSSSSALSTPWEVARSPRTIMSAARTDPFNSLPLELDLDGQRLFDFYVNDMPACSYGSHFRSPKAHNWYTSVFVPEGMKGAVAFQNTILVHAANTWAWVRNEAETTDTLLHRDRAVSMLREHLTKNPRDNSDVAIISCLSAAALEDFDPRPGHKEISWVHMRAAREMIRSRGGPAAFAHTRLGMLINWQDYILSGYETHGPSFSFDHPPPITTLPPDPTPAQPSDNIASMPSPPSSTSSALSETSPCVEPPSNCRQISTTYPMDEIRLHCEEFLDFLRRCEQLALYQKDNPESCDASRHTAVSGTSQLFQILAAPPGSRFTSSGDRKQMVARLTALMMLNAAFWDYRYTPLHAGNFLRTLDQALIDSEVSMSGSVEAILQILLACNDGYTPEWVTRPDGTISPAASELTPDFTQYSPTATSPSARPWFAGRMLKIAKRLSADSWYRINDFLFSCFTMTLLEPVAYIWETDLRREILEAPLTSYVMPSLM
ncbi:hypothetical protein N7507_010798 [Penicillium longicatenatum]|nr:hypothetical protein N7507_010798 [Penicillium longicatenatum]